MSREHNGVFVYRGMTIQADGCEAAIFDKNGTHVETIFCTNGTESAIRNAKRAVRDFFKEVEKELEKSA